MGVARKNYDEAIDDLCRVFQRAEEARDAVYAARETLEQAEARLREESNKLRAAIGHVALQAARAGIIGADTIPPGWKTLVDLADPQPKRRRR